MSILSKKVEYFEDHFTYDYIKYPYSEDGMRLFFFDVAKIDIQERIDYENKIEDLEIEVDQLASALEDKAAGCDNLDSEVYNLSRDLQDSESRIEDLERELDSAKDTISNLEYQIRTTG